MNVDGGIRQFEPERYLSEKHRQAVRRGLIRYWRLKPYCSRCNRVRVRGTPYNEKPVCSRCRRAKGPMKGPW